MTTRQILAAFKRRLNDRLEERIRADKARDPVPAPRYDRVYWDGVAWLDRPRDDTLD